MNVVAPQSHTVTSLSGRRTRVHPVLLAAVSSLIAAVLAAIGHVAWGLGEVPLVLATLLAASVVGWINVSTPTRHRT